jgi:dipeptidyl aminopeptidase/acylaminoacyl peptidase
MTLEWGTNDEPADVLAFSEGFPWEVPGKFQRASPIFQFGEVTTPTIFHVGANDPRCPPGNSRMLYRALQEYLKVPVEFIVYPGEVHGLNSYTNRRTKMMWDVAWFDHYVNGK